MELTKASRVLLERIKEASSVGDGSDGVWAYWIAGCSGKLTKQDRGNIADLIKKGLLTAEELDGDAFYTITPDGIAYMTDKEMKEVN